MIRIEVVVNQSIEEDVIGVFENCGLGESFTYLFPVYGRGRHGRREGSSVWPEENIIFIVFVEDSEFPSLLKALKTLKKEFINEGFRCYIIDSVCRMI